MDQARTCASRGGHEPGSVIGICRKEQMYEPKVRRKTQFDNGRSRKERIRPHSALIGSTLEMMTTIINYTTTMSSVETLGGREHAF